MCRTATSSRRKPLVGFAGRCYPTRRADPGILAEGARLTSDGVGQSRAVGQRNLWRRLGRAVGFAVVFSVSVVVLAWVVRAQVTPVVTFDEASINSATITTRASPGLRQVLLIWQELFQARWVNLVSAGLCVWVWRRHRLGSSASWAFLTLMVS